ncbi:MAG: hypothetical protein JNK30_17630 [Phenylobacterium sp.]|uniref:hypothetical protein n=1 Tax=Phenylobacterium sp. TaxID=1871053 RepID=UPI001A4BD57D|nr:hypothetical protein [Phenylobacterium sp.]MBL8773207.1 hypothetical protein [Phenylobacterium sp.]
MPDKHPDTERWGGPGASHEDRSEPKPKDKPRDGRGPDEPTNTQFSGVSGGGGERDRHHAHDAKGKTDSQQNSVQRGKSGQH